MKTLALIDGKPCEVGAGELLADVLRLHAIHADMPCAGKGLCRSCTVLVNGEQRLACQTRVREGDNIITGASDFADIAVGTQQGGSPKRPMYARFGLSIDIGTTTLCAALFDDNNGMQSVARKNPQTAYGADVISRIERAMDGEGDALARCIREAIAEMAEELAQSRGICAKAIDAVVITGNTAMLTLLTGQDASPLSRAPFCAKRLFGEFISPDALGLALAPGAKVYLARCISAFVGGDITTATLASGILGKAETALLVDVGTNGELALWHGGELLCCSTAAGPAFEGAGISRGMYGVPGAIDRVWAENGGARYSTIGACAARGICGSGIADALAVMLALGIIDETGAFDQGESFALGGVEITQADVRKIQLAKGSVRAGIETLLQSAGVEKGGARLYIAGGFGSRLNLESAAAIGLIPDELKARAVILGNAAHTGASMLLRDSLLIDATEAFAKAARTVALDANPLFTENYMQYMMFE